jgi:hypothetical protein
VATPVDALQVTVQLGYSDASGTWRTAETAQLQPGRHTYPITISGCAGGCRFAALVPVARGDAATVTFHALTEDGADLVPSTAWGDISRWHTQPDPLAVGPTLGTVDGALQVQVVPPGSQLPGGRHSDSSVFYAGVATPIPVVLLGEVVSRDRYGDPRITVLGVRNIPYRAVGTGIALPRLGSAGALMDLEYAQQSIGVAPESAALEVWLTANAPASIVDHLRASGVQILTDTTVADEENQLAHSGPGLSLRFGLFAAVVLLLLGAGILLVAASVDRSDRAAELAALRRQGLPRRAVRTACHVATLGVVGVATVAGVVAALVARFVVAAALPVFTDDWRVTAPATDADPLALLVAIGLSALILVPAAVFGAARTVAATDTLFGAATVSGLRPTVSGPRLPPTVSGPGPGLPPTAAAAASAGGAQ